MIVGSCMAEEDEEEYMSIWSGHSQLIQYINKDGLYIYIDYEFEGYCYFQDCGKENMNNEIEFNNNSFPKLYHQRF